VVSQVAERAQQKSGLASGDRKRRLVFQNVFHVQLQPNQSGGIFQRQRRGQIWREFLFLFL
jgi:hypothetical protein